MTQEPSEGGSHAKVVFLIVGGFFALAVAALLGVAVGQLPRPRRAGRAGRYAFTPARRTPVGTVLVRRARRSVGWRLVRLVDPLADAVLALGGEPGRERGNRYAAEGLQGFWSARRVVSAAATLMVACLSGLAVGWFVVHYVG